MTKGNVFMKSAKEAKDGMEAVMTGDKRQKKDAPKAEAVHCANVRVPESMWKKTLMHRADTGENFTQLVNRLLKEELG